MLQQLVMPPVKAAHSGCRRVQPAPATSNLVVKSRCRGPRRPCRATSLLCFNEKETYTKVRAGPSTEKLASRVEKHINSGTLFERIGGAPAVAAAVDRFYDKMMADNRVNFFFNNMDMKQQRAKQVAFMTYLFGGPEDYKGKDMTTAHQKLVVRMGMNYEHFDIVADHLISTLRELGVGEEVVKEVSDKVYNARPAVFGENASEGGSSSN